MSGRMTCSGMPERRATVRTWWGGTSRHCETADGLMPRARAMADALPHAAMTCWSWALRMPHCKHDFQVHASNSNSAPYKHAFYRRAWLSKTA